MPIRPLLLCVLFLAIAACSSKEQAPHQPPVKPAPTEIVKTEPIPAGFHTVSGQLLGAPAGTDVDLALLQVDANNRPQRLLANLTLKATGQPQSFRIPFNPQSFSNGLRTVLHGRVTRSGMLISRLPQHPVSGPQSTDLGTLRLVAAP